MSSVWGVSVDDTVGGGVVARCVHGIGASLIQGCLCIESIIEE